MKLRLLLIILLALGGCSKRDIPTSQPVPVLRAWVHVHGQSMLPTFPELVLVELEVNTPYESLQVGDTVIFWDYTRKDGLTHHRLVAKQFGNWIAKGDNPATNPLADRPWVTKDNYIARTTGRFTFLLSATKQ